MEVETEVSVSAMVEEVLRQHGASTVRASSFNMDSRKAEEAAARRCEAASWLRQIVGAVGTNDLAVQPSEEEFRLALRNGIVLCNALNKVQPGTIPKVVEAPSHVPSEGAALCAYQYFENVRNFLVALEDLKLPTFVASDLEKGGDCARVVSSVLALKSFSESKRQGSYRSNASGKLSGAGRYFVRRNAEPFMHSSSRRQSADLSLEQNLSVKFSVESNKMTTSHSLNMLVQTILSDRRPDEIPSVVESMLNKVMQEFERRSTCQNDLVKTAIKDISGTHFINTNALREIRPLYGQLKELREDLNSVRRDIENMNSLYSKDLTELGKQLHVLLRDASNYHKVLEENRRLYNQVQDLKGNIRVYCRVRPFLPGQACTTSTVANIDDGTITIFTPPNYGKGPKSFTFNKIFGPSASQEEVFSDTQPLIRSVLDGYNVCIFAYGQTGSGKTYTMSGPKILNEETLGVNYRALNDLFYLSELRKETIRYEISVQMIEIYNEQVRDLLAHGENRRVEIRGCSQNGSAVPDASFITVTSPSEVAELMNTGQKNRAVGATALNDRSSRSHSCLTVHVQGRELASGIVLRGCMHLVDLAGSERVEKSEAKGERLKEAQHINKSLSALGDVIQSLAQKNSHVPYRNSKLTQLLQDSLGGQAKTLMFVHVSPESDAIGETLSTLKFAERVATVELGAARMNKETGEVKDLKEQIATLREALARKEEEPELSQNTPSYMDARRIRSGIPRLRQPMEEVGNLEMVANNTTPIRKKSGPDQSDVMEENIIWPDSCSIHSGVWTDKLVDNSCNTLLENDPKYQQNGFRSNARYQQTNRTESVGTCDSDDYQDLGTSSSSDQEIPSVLEGLATPNRSFLSARKHQNAPKRNHTLSPYRGQEPSQSRDPSRRLSQTPKRNVMQPAQTAADRRRTPNGKLNSTPNGKLNGWK